MAIVNKFYSVETVDRGHRTWARIWITDDGSISILSDFGNYGYWFGSVAGEFRTFLCQCDAAYLQRKFCSQKVYDGKATGDAVRALIAKRGVDRHAVVAVPDRHDE